MNEIAAFLAFLVLMALLASRISRHQTRQNIPARTILDPDRRPVASEPTTHALRPSYSPATRVADEDESVPETPTT